MIIAELMGYILIIFPTLFFASCMIPFLIDTIIKRFR